MRDRLDDGATRLLLSRADSAGTITVQRRTSPTAWETGLADLKVEHGEVVASAAADGTVTIERFALTLEPIAIPYEVFQRDAWLSNVRAELAEPIVTETTWRDADEAHLRATLDLAFSWALTVDNNTAELGAPELPPVTIEVDVVGDGAFVHADLRAAAGGELWSWAGLIKLQDLNLVLAADTP